MSTFHTKPEIQQGLSEAFDSIIEYISQQEDPLFEAALADGKWTTGQQLEHLCKSVTPINKGLRLPKFLIKLKFGTISRHEYSFDELVSRYHRALELGGRASAAFIPAPILLVQKAPLLAKYQRQKNQLIRILDSWSEKQLSHFQAPHPLLGKLTIRELMYFTIRHNYHHLESIKKIH